MRFIGDLHGDSRKHLELISDCEESIQVGDLGFNYDYLKDVDPKHRFIFGNHDKQPNCKDQPHCLGNYGTFRSNKFKCFYLSGAWSIDYKLRTEGLNWWREEELSYYQLDMALEEYSRVKPRIVVTHSPPQMIYDIFLSKDGLRYFNVTENESKSRTACYLQLMWNNHQPKVWIFGHLHRTIRKEIFDTNFVGLNIGEYIDI